MLKKLISIFVAVLIGATASVSSANASERDYVKAWGKFATQTYSGFGDDVISLPKSIKARIVEATHSGSSNFAIVALDRSGESTDLIFNEIGLFQGINALGLSPSDPETKYLEVTADGSWTITLKSLEKSSKFARSGTGQAVMKYNSGFRIWKIMHSGKSNFAMLQYCSNGNSELLINEIGNYSGRKKFLSGSCVLVVEADGTWSIK